MCFELLALSAFKVNYDLFELKRLAADRTHTCSEARSYSS